MKASQLRLNRQRLQKGAVPHRGFLRMHEFCAWANYRRRARLQVLDGAVGRQESVRLVESPAFVVFAHSEITPEELQG